MEESRSVYSFWIGLSLAILSCFFIGSSFIIKKKGLLRLSRDGKTRAADGGFGYLKEWIWWFGLLSMAVGEFCNFTAYAFAPASLVTPLGGLSVIITAILASKYLNERLNLLSKIGCVLCLIGSTVTVIHAPEEKVTNSNQLRVMLLDSPFLIYLSFVVSTSVLLIFIWGRKYGTSNVLIYVTVCSLIGSISVMTCKGLGLLISEAISGSSLFSWLFVLLLTSTVLTVMMQMNYLNKALDVFDTSVVTPVYYVLFTTFVLIASSILFKEWPDEASDVLGTICGFLTIIIGIFLLNAFRNVDIQSNFFEKGLKRNERSVWKGNDSVYELLPSR